MNALSGKWISGDGFCLKLQSYPSGRIEGRYQTSLPGSQISLAFHGVSLFQNGNLTFAAVLECGRCQTMEWSGEITLHGSVDQSHSRMRVKWLATSGLTQPGTPPKSQRGSTVLLRFPHYFLWEPAFSSELFAPHALLVHERRQLKQGILSGQEQRKRATYPQKKRKL